MTFLRDPIQRVLSQFEFACLSQHGDLPDSTLARKFSLKDVLRRNIGNFGSFWNAQTFALSGLSTQEVRPEKHLQSALANLDRLDFVGMVETFAGDATELRRLLGGDPQLEIPYLNKLPHRPAREKFDEETLDLLSETQAMDQVLYDRAKKLRVKRNPPLFSKEGQSLAGWPTPTNAWGTGIVRITRVEVNGIKGRELRAGGEAEIIVHLITTESLRDIVIGLRIEDVLGNYVAGTNTLLQTERYLNLPLNGTTGSFKLSLNMGAGRYLINIAILRGTENVCGMNPAAVFEVLQPQNPYFEGSVDIKPVFTMTHPIDVNG